MTPDQRSLQSQHSRRTPWIALVGIAHASAVDAALDVNNRETIGAWPRLWQPGLLLVDARIDLRLLQQRLEDVVGQQLTRTRTVARGGQHVYGAVVVEW